jgi:hypothetical protein
MQCPSCGASPSEGAQSCLVCGRVVNGPEPTQGEQPAMQTGAPPGAEAPPLYFAAPPRPPLLAWNHVVAAIPLAVGVLVIFLTLGVALVCLLLRRDWAESAAVAAIAGLLGVVAVVIAVVPLLILRRFERVSLGLTALLLVAMTVASVGALTQQSALHRAQGQFLEDVRVWPGAINEYRRSGERQGHAPNMARVHLKWGEQLLDHSSFEDAVTILRLAQLDDESVAVQERAERGLYRAYMGWLAAKPPDQAWGEIASFLERYLTTKLCDAECQKTTRPSVALAYYQSGKQSLKTGLCSDAVTLYQRMASQYADTPNGKQAGADLAAPVTFTATVVDLPGKYQGVSAHLSRKVSPSDVNKINYLSKDYQATLGSDSRAIFHNVAPGRYNFSFDYPRGDQYAFHFWYVSASPFNPYSANVSPLCGGDETYPFS